MRLFLTVVSAAVLLASSAAFAQPLTETYGNQSGCASVRGDWDHVTDNKLTVSAGEVSTFEGSCDLPKNVSLTGRMMLLTCADEGDAFHYKVSLKMNPDSTMTVNVNGQKDTLAVCTKP